MCHSVNKGLHVLYTHITMDPTLLGDIQELLAAVECVPAPFRAVIQDIMDDPIPQNVKNVFF